MGAKQPIINNNNEHIMLNVRQISNNSNNKGIKLHSHIIRLILSNIQVYKTMKNTTVTQLQLYARINIYEAKHQEKFPYISYHI